YKVIQPPVANDDTVVAIEGLFPSTRATGTFTVTELTANDTNFDPTSFSLVSATTVCAGSVQLNLSNEILYEGPPDLLESDPCLTNDEFTYEVCSVDISGRCDTGTVFIEINRRPTVDELFTCMPAGSTRTTQNVFSLYDDP